MTIPQSVREEIEKAATEDSPCQAPLQQCDSYGICSGCTMQMQFEDGAEFGFNLATQRAEKLVKALESIGVENPITVEQEIAAEAIKRFKNE